VTVLQGQLVELEQHAEQFREKGLGVAAISYDSVAILKNFAERQGIHYPLLSDPESKIIRAFGILNEKVPKDTAFYGIPHPVTYIVDNKGVVVAKYFENDYRQRYTAADILVRQFGEEPRAARSETQTEHLKLSCSSSNAVVRPGQRIALAVEVDLKPGMHVYAPGVQGYIPINWQMNASEGWAAHDASYPKPEMLHLAVIEETVPVYKGNFRILRDLTIGQAKQIQGLVTAAGELIVSGSLRYQACDDTQCYIPKTVPLTWKLRVESLDRTRVPEELRRKSELKP
jgi:hypothetical protein